MNCITSYEAAAITTAFDDVVRKAVPDAKERK